MPIKIDPSHSSVAQDSRIRTLVLHYTALDDKQSLDVLEKKGQVSAHYLVPTPNVQRDDNQYPIYELVNPARRAWHAGTSQWQGVNNINFSSIGIEIVNPGWTEEASEQAKQEGKVVWDSRHKRWWYRYPKEQIEAVIELAGKIVKDYSIQPDRVVGHSDIAPGRKQDPGPLFPYLALAEAGVGAWPSAAMVEHYKIKLKETPLTQKQRQDALKRYGYNIEPGAVDQKTQAAITAFQMHYAPRDYFENSNEHTDAALCALVTEYHPSKVSAIFNGGEALPAIQGGVINIEKFSHDIAAHEAQNNSQSFREPYRLSAEIGDLIACSADHCAA